MSNYSLLIFHFSLFIFHSSFFTLHFSLFTSASAPSIQIQIMVQDIEFENLTHGRLDLLDPGITKLNHLATINTDQMIMLFEAKRFLVLREVFSKLMFGDEVTGDEEL